MRWLTSTNIELHSSIPFSYSKTQRLHTLKARLHQNGYYSQLHVEEIGILLQGLMNKTVLSFDPN